MNEEDIKHYYEFLGHDIYDVRAFTPEDSTLDTDITDTQRVEDVETFINFCQKHDGKANIYAGVLPKSADGKGKDAVQTVDKVWIELDAERTDTGAASEGMVDGAKNVADTIIDDHQEKFGRPLLVMSGNGYHLIWEIPPIDIDDTNREKLNQQLKEFCHYFKREYETDTVEVDTAVGELARILKIPGTESVKGEEDQWRTAEIVHKEKQTVEQQRRLKDFTLMLDEIQNNTNDQQRDPSEYQGTDDSEKLEWVIEHNDDFRSLYLGNATSKYDSRSEAEMALANYCVFYGLDIDSVLSQAHIGKWAEAGKSYQKATKQEAISEVTDEFDWSDIDGFSDPETDTDDESTDEGGGDSETTPSRSWNNVIMGFEEDENTAELTKRITSILLNQEQFKTPRDTQRTWHFKNPVYESDGEQTIEEILWENLNGYITRNQVNEVKESIKARTFINRREERAPSKYIPVENGWYNIETGDLAEPDPSYFIINHVPVEYDPDADCPKFKDFVSEIVVEEDLPLIQEMFGYCLYREYPLARAFMLLGTGGNGKSTLLEMLEKFIGNSNVANPSLQKLGEDRFASAQLYGKLANIHADLSSRTLQDTGTFKMLTGGDLIHAERKFEDPFQFRNYAKLIYSANELPQTKDTTEAFFRRWIVVKFPFKFTEDPDDGNKDKIPDIEKNIIEDDEEMSGIFNWAMEGLERILDEGKFSKGQSREQVKYEWLLRSQPMTVFFDAAIEDDPDTQIGKQRLYEQYSEFCTAFAAESKQKSTFFKQLYSEVPNAKEKRIRTDSGRKKVIEGVGLKELGEVVRLVGGKLEPRMQAGAGTHARMPARVDLPHDQVDQEDTESNNSDSPGAGEPPQNDHPDQGSESNNTDKYSNHPSNLRSSILSAVDEVNGEDPAPIEEIAETADVGVDEAIDALESLKNDSEVFEAQKGGWKVL